MLDTPATYASKLTGGGRSAIAVICVLGPGAAAAIARCFVRYQRSPKPGHELAIDRIYYGDWIGVHPAATTSGNSGEGLVVCRTADERFEIHCHGGAAAIDTILNDLAQCGCEIVPCWDHPKLLPSISLERQCLEVLVQTKTATTAAIAQAQYQGALRTAYEQLLQSIEVNDKPSALAQTKRLLDIATVGEHLVEPFRVALLGQPNAGKSSLLNQVAGWQRAIVSPIAGTTRDTVGLDFAIHGWPFRMHDTAGLRATTDALEQAGIERTQAMLSSADLLVLVVDGTAPNEQDLEAWVGDGKATPQLWVWNKCDLAPPSRSRNWLATSATQGTGIAELLEAIFRECVQINVDPSAAMPLTEGQLDTLRHVEQAIRDEKWSIAAQFLRSSLER